METAVLGTCGSLGRLWRVLYMGVMGRVGGRLGTLAQCTHTYQEQMTGYWSRLTHYRPPYRGLVPL
jgi:hypothetical protein